MAYKILWGQSDGLLLFINAGKKCIINHFDDLWVFIYLTITSLLAQKLVNWLFYFIYLFCSVLKLFWFESCL